MSPMTTNTLCLAEATISPVELNAILQLIELFIDTGIYEDSKGGNVGKCLLSVKDTQKLYERLVAAEEASDAKLAKPYICRLCGGQTKEESGYCSENKDCAVENVWY